MLTHLSLAVAMSVTELAAQLETRCYVPFVVEYYTWDERDAAVPVEPTTCTADALAAAIAAAHAETCAFIATSLDGAVWLGLVHGVFVTSRGDYPGTQHFPAAVTLRQLALPGRVPLTWKTIGYAIYPVSLPPHGRADWMRTADGYPDRERLVIQRHPVGGPYSGFETRFHEGPYDNRKRWWMENEPPPSHRPLTEDEHERLSELRRQRRYGQLTEFEFDRQYAAIMQATVIDGRLHHPFIPEDYDPGTGRHLERLDQPPPGSPGPFFDGTTGLHYCVLTNGDRLRVTSPAGPAHRSRPAPPRAPHHGPHGARRRSA